MNKKIRVAFIKFGGLASGGTEKYLQTIAVNLPSDKFIVDYFYCDASPYLGSDWVHPTTDPEREAYMRASHVNLIKFNVEYKDVRIPTHDWVKTNFWDLFKEENYDVIQTGRAGHPEYPFIHIKETPIVDSIHLSGMIDNQANIFKVIHICQTNAEIWTKCGGNSDKIQIIYPPVLLDEDREYIKNLRDELNIPEKAFVFGMHQRNDTEIYSPVPLEAFKKLQKNNDKIHFVLLT